MPAKLNLKNHPLSLYVHWPFCVAKCPYCDFNSHMAGKIETAAWRNALLTELGFRARQAAEALSVDYSNIELKSLFFGGGTPSLMPPQITADIIDCAAGLFKIADDIEITAEMNPTSVETEKLNAFAHAGINRVSVGVQSLDEAGLKFLGREHDTKEALSAITAAKRIFPSVSADLIYGLPEQTPANWTKQLNKLLSFELGHMSCYQLTIETGTIFHTRARQGDVLTADDDAVAHLYMVTEEVLNGAGLNSYEVSNYAKPGQASTHNLNYWKAGDWLAIGPGAHGRLTTANGRLHMANRKSPDGWLSDINVNGHSCETQIIETKYQSFEEYWMMGLRLCEGRPLTPPPAFGGGNFFLHRDWLNIFIQEGWLEINNNSVRTTLQGRLRLNTILPRLLDAPENELKA
ncbi:MAG: coproporphyrinogen III oxidase [Rhodospirillaceae bacterium]|nr:coproporphyrinogen III oxidase [Rhodospirillaceae bacterium]